MRHPTAALILALAGTASPSQANHIVINLPPPSIYIAVGSMGATIDTVTFPLGAQPLGTPVAQLEAPVLIEIAYRRGGNATPNRVFVTMTPTPAAGLADVSGTYFVPWTQFSWTSSNNAQLPSGTFTGAPNQALVNFNVPRNRTRFREASFTYRYNNAITVPVGGTYAGRVTFTASTP
jgi:hypothetical protein